MKREREDNSIELARHILNEFNGMIFVGTPRKGGFYGASFEKLIDEKLMSWLGKKVTVKKINEVKNILRKVCELEMVKDNPMDIFERTGAKLDESD